MSATSVPYTFERDAAHWLYRYSPDEWIRTALTEMRRAEAAYRAHDIRGGLALLRRAAGMALNAALIVEPTPAWGRTFVEHVRGLSRESGVPAAVRASAELLLRDGAPSNGLVVLRAPTHDTRVIEAAKDVVAHAYAVVVKHGGMVLASPASKGHP